MSDVCFKDKHPTINSHNDNVCNNSMFNFNRLYELLFLILQAAVLDYNCLQIKNIKAPRYYGNKVCVSVTMDVFGVGYGPVSQCGYRNQPCEW